ncbi:MAG: penicillin-binding protein 2 [Lachnospiraceae bacterium]|nr:penicillin-binding protein 2 [Lachnospiraceae bacterium]
MAKKKKKTFRITRKMQKKLTILFGLVLCALIGLIARLMYIEYTKGEQYQKKVLAQQYDSAVIPYQRGSITDCKGTLLATSIDVYNVILDCKVINSSGKDQETVNKTIDATVKALITCFPDFSEEQIRGYLRDKPDSQYVVLAKQLSYEEIQPFIEMKNDSKTYPDIAGVWFEKEYQRQYPYGTLASAVLGFTASGNAGMNGVESYYNDVLNGIAGREYGYLNTDNNFEKTVTDAVDGNNVVLTIDANIQSIAEKKIADFQEKHRNEAVEGAGSKHTAVLVMNPRNGEVLAMANYPNYDSSDPWNLSAYCTDEEIAQLDEETRLDLLNELWTNFCISYTYEPGSTIKPLTVATGLDTGTLTGNETFECDGGEQFADYKVKCVNVFGHGTETLEDAIKDSCNDALMQMSYRIGAENFSTYQKNFGFGYKTNIDLPGEARTDTLIYDEEDLKKTLNLATNSFGQNFNVTMIQMGGAFSSLINGGYYYQPHVMKKITDRNGNTVEEYGSILLRETISERTSEQVRQYLYATVSDGGTGVYAKVPGYSMGGKTGTAQKLPRGQGNFLVSFIGYAPAETPQVVVYVVVDEPNVEDQAHSTYAQEIAKEIFAEILPYLGIYPDEEVPVGADTDPSAAEADGTEDVPAAAPEGTGQQQIEDVTTSAIEQQELEDTDTQ